VAVGTDFSATRDALRVLGRVAERTQDALSRAATQRDLGRIQARLLYRQILPEDDPRGQAEKFRLLVKRWRDETSHISSSTARLLHAAYLQIIGIGPPAVPLILAEMRDRGGHWGMALSSITGEDPVSESDRGKARLVKAAWLKWGRDHGHIA